MYGKETGGKAPSPLIFRDTTVLLVGQNTALKEKVQVPPAPLLGERL
jgi:hypothetical protein